MGVGENYGFITPFFEWLFSRASEFPSRFFATRRSQLKIPGEAKTFNQKRATQIDVYVCFALSIEILCCLAVSTANTLWLRIIITLLLTIRSAEISLTNVNISIFEPRKKYAVASVVRTLILTVINYVELWICFGGIYACWPVLNVDRNLWTALYFSGTTQLTIGYGEVHPIGLGRAVALLQGWIGLMFALLILGRLVGVMPTLKDFESEGASSDTRIIRTDVAGESQQNRPYDPVRS